MKRILNLYAGIGGNRKLWDNVEVVAVEINPVIAGIYQDYFPNDEVIISDAHRYLLKHYKDDWDFIWSSPPCITHTILMQINEKNNGGTKYPDMRLYQEIIWLKHFSRCKFVVENVITYYKPLIKPQKIGKHYYWSNFHILRKDENRRDIAHFDGVEKHSNIDKKEKEFGFDLNRYGLSLDLREKMLKNCVRPEMGKHIFDCAFNLVQSTLDYATPKGGS